MSIAQDLQTIAENVPRVYSAGVEAGKAQGGGGGNDTEIIRVLTTALQNKGKSTIFDDTFNGSPIDDATLSVIMENWGNYSITRANRMFQDTKNISEALYTDKLDFSKCQSLLSAFINSTVKKLKVIDARATTDGWSGMADMFRDCSNLETIDEFYPSKNTKFNGTFGYCKNLITVVFKSEVAVNGLHLGQSTLLDKQSIDSVMYWLSSTTTGFTVTFSLSAVNKAYETSEGANDGSTSAEWLAKVAEKPNWTIAYA